MYKITYRGLKNSHSRTFIILAESLISADQKLRNVYREELRSSIIAKHTKLSDQPMVNIQHKESQVLSGSDIEITSQITNNPKS